MACGRWCTKRRNINGWLIIDKPGGITSTGVCNVIKKLSNGAKVGHGGTLDPLATGVLPVALGEATKTVSYVMDRAKTYEFTLRWGEARDTDDAEGQVTATSGVRPSAEEIEVALPRFRGPVQQVPPIYSAIKVAGKRAYNLARGNQEVVLEPRLIEIHTLTLQAMPDADHAVFRAKSGKGAYMRWLARDISKAVGTVGHIAALRRIAVGPFDEASAYPLAKLKEVGNIGQNTLELLPVETALADIPALAISKSEAAGLWHGRPVALLHRSDIDQLEAHEDGSVLRATWEGKAVALVQLDAGQAKPLRIIQRPARAEPAIFAALDPSDEGTPDVYYA